MFRSRSDRIQGVEARRRRDREHLRRSSLDVVPRRVAMEDDPARLYRSRQRERHRRYRTTAVGDEGRSPGVDRQGEARLAEARSARSATRRARAAPARDRRDPREEVAEAALNVRASDHQLKLSRAGDPRRIVGTSTMRGAWCTSTARRAVPVHLVREHVDRRRHLPRARVTALEAPRLAAGPFRDAFATGLIGTATSIGSPSVRHDAREAEQPPATIAVCRAMHRALTDRRRR